MVLAEKATGTRSTALGEAVRGRPQESRSAQQGDCAWSRGPGGQTALHSALPHSGSEGYQQRRPRKREGPARSPHGALPRTTSRPRVFTGSPCCYPHGAALSGPAGSSAPGHLHGAGESCGFACPQAGSERIVPFLFGILKCINKKTHAHSAPWVILHGAAGPCNLCLPTITTLERQWVPASRSSPLELGAGCARVTVLCTGFLFSSLLL